MQKKQIVIRLSDEQRNQLDDLCKLHNVTITEFFRKCIDSEYDTLKGNPKLKQALEQLNNLNNLINSLGKGRES